MKRKSSQRNRSTRLNFSRSFETLEPRRMLAGDLPLGANLIENAEFEETTGSGTNGYFDQADVAAWSTSDSVSSGEMKLFNFAGVPERGLVLDIDSSADIDAVFQDIETVQDQSYLLSFDFRTGHQVNGADAATNDVEVIWDGESMGVFRPDDQWKTVVLNVTGSATDISTRLQFSEVAAGNNSFGSYIDDVRLVHFDPGKIGNFSFENTSGATGTKFSSREVNSWNAIGDRDADLIGIETGAASDGERYLNLDSDSTQVDRIVQRLDTSAGQTYYVTFDIKSSSGESDSDNEVRVRWNSSFMGGFQGGADWETVGMVVTADSDKSRLVFREPGESSDGFGTGQGPFIDNVRVYEVLPGFDSLVVDANGDTAGSDSTASFTEDDGPTVIASPDLTLTNTANSELTGAVVLITNVKSVSDESLSVDTGDTNIRATYDAENGRLRLAGRASVADYQTVLQTLKYDNTSDNPDTEMRRVGISVDHRTAFSERAFIDVSITPTNDDPVIDFIANRTHTALNPLTIQVTGVDPEGSDFTYGISSEGTALATGETGPEISSTGEITWTPQQTGSLAITVTITDDQGGSDSQTFVVTSAANAPVPDDFLPFSGNGQLSNVLPGLRNNIYSAAPEMNIDLALDYTAILKTDDGEITISLFDNEAPVTVNNFVNLARDGYFDGLTFHRVVSLSGSSSEGYIAQGGDPKGDGFGGPGYIFGDEILPNRNFDKGGYIAMANSGVGTGTNGSQFFFNFDENVTHLNQNHTIYGEITSGIEVLDQINKINPSFPSSIPPEIIRSVKIIASN